MSWAAWVIYHEEEDANCPACYQPPIPCECGGLIHSQFPNTELDSIKTICDLCEEETSSDDWEDELEDDYIEEI